MCLTNHKESGTKLKKYARIMEGHGKKFELIPVDSRESLKGLSS
jgi:hypothetical protein